MEDLLEDKMDKVEFAFRKFDSDGDGYLSWEEFQQVTSSALHHNLSYEIIFLENLLILIILELFLYQLFQLVKNLDQEQALRIFHSCNQVIFLSGSQTLLPGDGSYIQTLTPALWCIN